MTEVRVWLSEVLAPLHLQVQVEGLCAASHPGLPGGEATALSRKLSGPELSQYGQDRRDHGKMQNARH